MKLDTNSWHFKIYKRWLELKCGDTLWSSDTIDDMLLNIKRTRHHNLCLYMRAVMFYGPVRMFFNSIECVLGLVIAFILGYIGLELYYINEAFTQVSFGIILSIGILIGATLLVGGIEYLKSKYQKREPKDKKPNIFLEYVKAKKSKVCPMLTFNDEDDNA